MNSVIISLVLCSKDGMRNLQILVDENNKHKVRIAVNGEISRIKRKLNEYKKKGIIHSTISKNPKILNRRYRKKIKNLIYSRSTLNRALKLISMIK